MSILELPTKRLSPSLLLPIIFGVILFTNVPTFSSGFTMFNVLGDFSWNETQMVEISDPEMEFQPEIVASSSDLWAADALNVVAKSADSLEISEIVQDFSGTQAYAAEFAYDQGAVIEFDQGSVQAYVEADTFASQSELQFVDLKESASSASEYFHHFQIEAVDSAVGEFHGQFNKPVRLILTFDEAEYDLS
ncbi:MAG: hypothetical protein AAGD96_31055, partial [Chloroflexota bacterium]